MFNETFVKRREYRVLQICNKSDMIAVWSRNLEYIHCIAKDDNFVLSQEVENALFSQNPISFDFLSILVMSASAALPLPTWETSVDVNLCLSNIPGIVAPWFGEV